MTPEARNLYDRCAKMQGHLFKCIGDLESVKLSLLDMNESDKKEEK